VTSSSLARFIAGSALAAILAAAPIELSAKPPSPKDLSGLTASGAYLAARHAGRMRDAAAAAEYYRAALARDPKNDDLLDRAFLSLVIDGNIPEAVKFAERVVHADKNDRVARLVLGVHALKEKHYGTARRDLGHSVRGPITDLTGTLLTAWSEYGSGDVRAAVASIDRLRGPDWYAIFKDLHAGMMLDLAGNEVEAGKRFEHAYKLDSTALRVVEAYGSWLSRNGKKDAARKVFADFNKVLPNHPLVTKAMKQLGSASPAKPEIRKEELLLPADTLLVRGSTGASVKTLQSKLGITADGVFGRHTLHAVREFQERSALRVDGIVGPTTTAKLNKTSAKVETATETGGKLPRLVSNAQAGAAEALYGLGASLGRRGGEDLGLVYLQLALYLAPEHPLALLSLADLYESLKKPDLALKVYERVPAASPLHRNALIQMASDLDTLNRPEEAQKHLDTLLKEHPDDQEVIMALGNVQRGHKKFAACADTYSKGIALIPHPDKSNWVIFYFRGICYERSHQWPKAEADLQEALKVFPEQPHVLNYLGYSWIDQGTHLDQGMAMIKRAVQQRPDDGYIVDSLGWAYYKLGNYDQAVKQLERAIELKPEDPTINDHLGDAYWRVGRTLEAKFQWAHARDMKPDPEELVKIEDKLKNGLPNETSSQAKAGNKPEKKNDGGG
jgi:tetratricopeptide (TPR) repeat protein